MGRHIRKQKTLFVTKVSRTATLLLLALFGLPVVALAAQSASSNFQVNEVFFGSGGELNACSNNYCSKQAAGELATGNASSANFQAQAGFNTNREPYIQFTVSNTNVNLGTLSPTSTSTATSSFSVKSYLSHGYTVINASDPPQNGPHTLQPLSIPAGSSAGTEQFGMNLVANTSPATIGTDPVYVPDSSFSFGVVDADYNAPNTYKYAKGDTIASSSASTSVTTYTVSYIFNISHVTPGGEYSMHHVLVATGTY